MLKHCLMLNRRVTLDCTSEVFRHSEDSEHLFRKVKFTLFASRTWYTLLISFNEYFVARTYSVLTATGRKLKVFLFNRRNTGRLRLTSARRPGNS